MARPPGIPQPQQRRGPSAGNREKLSGYVLPELYEKARRSAAAANLSIGAYLERLISADETDDEGRPLWTPAPTPGAEPLPLAG